MTGFLSFFFLARIFLLLLTDDPELRIIEGKAQGTTYRILYEHSVDVSSSSVDSIFDVIDRSLSLYVPGSLINQFNESGAVLMDRHMSVVVNAAFNAYFDSQGVFDITALPLSEFWGFGSKKQSGPPANRKEFGKRRSLVGCDRMLDIRGDSLIALRNGVRIDCNGLAQGYTVDVLYDFLRTAGVKNFLVELGGEVRASGRHPQRGNWLVGIEGPSSIAENWHPVVRSFSLDGKAVTTSGSYRNFVKAGSNAYTHIIDPITGKQVENGVISVTVTANDAITADVYDNVFFIWGWERTMQFLRGKKDLGVCMVYRDANGEIRSGTYGIVFTETD